MCKGRGCKSTCSILLALLVHLLIIVGWFMPWSLEVSSVNTIAALSTGVANPVYYIQGSADSSTNSAAVCLWKQLQVCGGPGCTIIDSFPTPAPTPYSNRKLVSPTFPGSTDFTTQACDTGGARKACMGLTVFAIILSFGSLILGSLDGCCKKSEVNLIHGNAAVSAFAAIILFAASGTWNKMQTALQGMGLGVSGWQHSIGWDCILAAGFIMLINAGIAVSNAKHLKAEQFQQPQLNQPLMAGGYAAPVVVQATAAPATKFDPMTGAPIS